MFFFIKIFFCSPLPLRSWMFEHDCLNTCAVLGVLQASFVYLYLYLFSEIEHVSHGKVL